MTTLTRPQLVLQSLQSDGTFMTHTTLEVEKTATMTYGTLLEADGTESTDTTLTAGTVTYVIDDHCIDEVDTGTTTSVSVVSGLDWVTFREELLNIGGTALTTAQLTTFGKRTQAEYEA